MNDGSCSDECKEALDDFTDAQGCCVAFLFDFPFSYILDLNSDTDEKLSANLFSTCGVRVPGVCNSFSPPDEFRDCAHDGDGDGNDGDGDSNDGDGNGKDGDVHATPLSSSVLYSSWSDCSIYRVETMNVEYEETVDYDSY